VRFLGASATAAEADVSTVRGKIITASTQQPLGEMPVELRKTTGELIQRTAASPTGDFVFEKLAVGDYWVAFASPGAAQEDQR
jgi:hypothetical protein